MRRDNNSIEKDGNEQPDDFQRSESLTGDSTVRAIESIEIRLIASERTRVEQIAAK